MAPKMALLQPTRLPATMRPTLPSHWPLAPLPGYARSSRQMFLPACQSRSRQPGGPCQVTGSKTGQGPPLHWGPLGLDCRAAVPPGCPPPFVAFPENPLAYNLIEPGALNTTGANGYIP